MIALDTNVLVRFLVEDDKEQSRRATALIVKASRSDEPLYVADLVVAETVWVLMRSYKLPKDEIIDILRRLLLARQLTFGAVDTLSRALDGFALGKGDFADYLIRESAKAAGCDRVATFDRALLKEPGFSIP